jgi:hypothetical protein
MIYNMLFMFYLVGLICCLFCWCLWGQRYVFEYIVFLLRLLLIVLLLYFGRIGVLFYPIPFSLLPTFYS